MSNSLPTRLTDLTFRGTDIQRSNLSVHLDVVSGLNDGLDVRGSDTVIPSAAGRIPRSRVADVRHIIVAGIIQGVGVTEALRRGSAQNLIDEMEALFDPLADPGTLVGMAADGTWRAIDVRTQPGVMWPDPIIPGVHVVSILLDSVEPHWQITGGGS